MQRKMFTWIALVSVALLVLGGCGSNKDSGGDSTTGTPGSFGTDANGIVYVGASTCIGCHEDFSWSSEIVAKFLASTHVIHSTHIEASSEELCLSCHDPIGDGITLESYIDPANVPADGLAAVTCEDCHGAGGEHYGVGPIPAATPDYNACGQCHNDGWTTIFPPHIAHHPEGNNIVEDYVTSAHFDASGRNEPICVKCHNDEGGRKYKDVTTYAALSATLPIEGETHSIQCRTCHDPHNPGELLKPEETTNHGATVVASAEYATCTNCHQRHDAQITTDAGTGEVVVTNQPGSTSSDGGSGDLIYHAARYTRVISSTHYDNPATADVIEGYTMDPANERACRDCHNVHSANIEINEQWAESGHGGKILEGKKEYVIDNGGECVDATTGDTIPCVPGDYTQEIDDHSLVNVSLYRAGGSPKGAWNDYPWSQTDGTLYGIYAIKDCQQCHTATGYANKMGDPANYDAANNTFPNLVDWTAAGGSTQYELLYCWGCHTSANSGELRASGATTLDYTIDGNPVVIPDLGNSNACIICHAGWGSEGPTTVNGDSRGAFHHAAAAAVMFAAETHIASEFPGQDYVIGYFKHDDIGIADESGTGTSGPCVGCHMGESADHTWEIIKHDENGAAFVPQATQDFCAKCHAGHGDVTAEFLEEESADYQDAGKLLADLLDNTVPNYTGAAVTAANVPENDVRAYENNRLVSGDAAGYAHNRQYCQKILFDSIDWLDNGVLDGTITIDAAAYPGAAAWLRADEITGVATRP